MNTVVCNLIDSLLSEQFDSSSVSVANSLLLQGASTAKEIMENCKLSFNQVKSALVVLLQHKCIKFEEDKNPEKPEEILATLYSINIPQILFRLKLPKILVEIENLFGELGSDIVQTFCSFGIISSFDCYEQLKNKYKVSKEQVEKVLVSLIEKGFVVETQFTSSESKSEAKVEAHPLLFDQNKGKYKKLFINSGRLEKELLNYKIVQYIHQRVNMQAGLLCSFLLSMSNSSEIKGITFTHEGLMEHMNETNQKMKKEAVEKNLNLLTSFDFLEKNGLNNEGEELLFLNLKVIGEDIKTRLVEQNIEESLSSQHLRIFRFLSRCGPLDMKNVLN